MILALAERQSLALDIVQQAAQSALAFFRDIDHLDVEQKGLQDLVSNADRSVESQIRKALSTTFPDDGIIGEEEENIASSSGYTWVIDPIDGTSNFVRGIPGWCVVLACVHDGTTILGIIIDPLAEETFIAAKGSSTTLNGKSVSVSRSQSLAEGSTGVGQSLRVPAQLTINALTSLLENNGVFYRNASGALMLAYVAAGRLIGYCEPHMNAWDCMAALLMVEEAGGIVSPFDTEKMLSQGEKVVCACPGVYKQLEELTQSAYSV